jgi:imidazole glycerol-phosphate synthase subunit HisH
MIGIVDYGMGNLLSVYNACEMVGADVQICRTPNDLKNVERIILPGIGAFRDCSHHLFEEGFADVLNEEVLHHKKPILGICLGMQIMARKGLEGGEWQGLGWFDAVVQRIAPEGDVLRVPHIGWNTTTYVKEHPLFMGLPLNVDFYYVHSYQMVCNNPTDVIAMCEYKYQITSAVSRDNIFATQFHPEKSQDYGLHVLGNFVRWNG